MSLKDSINSDGKSLFLGLQDFAEVVTYAPRQQSGKPPRLPRNIKAVVFRRAMQVVGEDGGASITPYFEVHVANDPVLGISGTELDTGGDQIIIPIRDGMPPVPRTIMLVAEQDEGMLVVECR
jgi:hypothetical protein